jgi:hypothetical protein
MDVLMAAQLLHDHGLLEPAKPNLFLHNGSLVVGVALVVVWIIYSPRIRVKRFSTWFWLGMALCAIIGPALGGLWK